MADESDRENTEETLQERHKRELKQLQAEIQKLKHSVPKGDKKRKKEVTNEIAQLEAKLQERHETELAALSDKEVSEVADDLGATGLGDCCGNDLGATGFNIVENSTMNSGKKMSKAQKRREKKAQQGQEREEMIRDQEVENLSGVRHVEAQKLKALLAARSLAIYEIPSDGNCLYAAIADQQKRQDMQTNVATLRRQAADYMRAHQDDFLPFLCKPATGDPYSPEEYVDYCDRIQNTADWGGQLELRALSNVLQKPIEVVQAEAPVITLGEEHFGQKLVLSFHHHAYGLGAHYNSVVDKSSIPEPDDNEGFT